MPDALIPRTALGGTTGALRSYGSARTVLIAELPLSGALDLRLDPRDGAALAAARECLGYELPKPNASAQAADLAVLWLGPDEWLVVTPDGSQAALAVRLRSALSNRHAAVTDVSDARATFDVSGPCSRDLLRKGCAVDLHPREFTTGHSVVTALGRVRVILRQTAELPAYRVWVDRSNADYLWSWLSDAALEFVAAQ